MKLLLERIWLRVKEFDFLFFITGMIIGIPYCLFFYRLYVWGVLFIFLEVFLKSADVTNFGFAQVLLPFVTAFYIKELRENATIAKYEWLLEKGVPERIAYDKIKTSVLPCIALLVIRLLLGI